MKKFYQTSAIAILALAGPMAASAQDLCGGQGTGGQWIGGSENVSDISTAANYAEQMALVLGGNQYVALFSLSEQTDVRIEAQGRGAGDPMMDVFDASGQLVVSDDDSGGNGAARVETNLMPGTYCVAMRSFNESPMTGFVRVGRQDQEALTTGITDSTDTGDGTEPIDDTEYQDVYCDSTTPATDLVMGTPVTASVDESAYYRFTLDADTPITITAENLDADPYVTLFSDSGEYINENDDFDGLNSRLEVSSPLAAGSYCIALQALSDTTQPITVTLGEYDPVAAMQAMINRGDAPPPLDGTFPVATLGELKTRLRQDFQSTENVSWFSFDVTESSLVLIEAISAGGTGDPFLVLYDDLGRKVGYADDGADGLDPLLTSRVSNGSYILGVGEIDSSTSSMIRMSIERYVPAK